jgi:hypothetical protein
MEAMGRSQEEIEDGFYPYQFYRGKDVLESEEFDLIEPPLAGASWFKENK